VTVWQERILAAKVEILRYADMFQGIRKQTMVEAQDTVARIVTQTDIFDELRHRREVLEARKASLMTEHDELLAAQSDIQYGGERQLVNTRKQIDKLGDEVAQLRTEQATNEAQLKNSGDVKIQAGIIMVSWQSQSPRCCWCRWSDHFHAVIARPS